MGQILERELSYKIQGCIYSVANKYGKGFKENIYQNALAEELEIAKLLFEQQKRIDIFSFESGKKLGVYVPDFIVDNKIIIEIKASNFTTKQDKEQQLSYLRVSSYEIGYLVNFCSPRLEIKRVIYTNNRKPFLFKRTLQQINTNQ